MRRRLELAQVADDMMVDGTAVEVVVYAPEGEETYLVGSRVEDGETAVLRVVDEEPRPWVLADYTVLDAIEALQTMEACDVCCGGGVVEHVALGSTADPASPDVRECDECRGKGWVE